MCVNKNIKLYINAGTLHNLKLQCSSPFGINPQLGSELYWEESGLLSKNPLHPSLLPSMQILVSFTTEEKALPTCSNVCMHLSQTQASTRERLPSKRSSWYFTSANRTGISTPWALKSTIQKDILSRKQNTRICIILTLFKILSPYFHKAFQVL